MEKIILSLFDFSGNWSKPYRENGYDVRQVDIKLGTDIYEYEPPELVYGILAAPPCTDFACSGARWFAEKDRDGRTDASIRLLKKTLDIIKHCNPNFWVLENPTGRLNSLIPELRVFGPKYFQPFWYGDPFRKKTGLWGRFNFPEPTNKVEPKGVRKGQPDEWYSKVGGKSEKTKEYRSMTPMGFAYAFYEVNK